MATNGFLTFAGASGSNVVTDLVYQASNARQQGVTKGTAASNLANKAWLQSSVAASVLMQFAVDYSGVDCTDSTPLATLETNLRAAIAASQAGASYGIDTSSTANVVTIALVPTPTMATFSSFQHIWIKVANTNTGPVVVNENAFTQRNLLRNDGAALVAGDIRAGQIYAVVNESGAFKLSGLARSQIGPAAATSTEVQKLTLKGATRTSAFTPLTVLTDISPLNTDVPVQSVTITGASFCDVRAICSCQNQSASLARITISVKLSPLPSGESNNAYVGLQNVNGSQTPGTVVVLYKNLDPTITYTIQMTARKADAFGPTPVLDANLVVLHDGN